MLDRVVVDVAGGGIGGAARWRGELDTFLATGVPGVRVIGRGRYLTPGWLVRREREARRAPLAVAPNNASFAVGGGQRRVLLRNALHFLHPSERQALRGLPRAFHAQIAVVRLLLNRADLVVVPSASMADRVVRRVPAVRSRIVVRPHPVSPVGPRQPVFPPFILAPVVPAPYKNLVPQLASLLAALDRAGEPIEVRVTAHTADLPDGLARHPRLVTLGRVPHATLAEMWRQATAAFYPSTLESFGYPLAEARVYGVPVLAPDSAQARELAGTALRPYRIGDLESLTEAVARLAAPVPAEPDAFDRDDYFRWLLDLPMHVRSTTPREADGITS